MERIKGEVELASNKNLTLLARKLRRTATKEETKLWHHLRNSSFEGLKFKRQYVIGDYIVDFFCESEMLVIELDGSQHLESENDKIRDTYLEDLGLTVLRFWNNEINKNIEGVLLHIREAIKKLDSSPWGEDKR